MNRIALSTLQNSFSFPEEIEIEVPAKEVIEAKTYEIIQEDKKNDSTISTVLASLLDSHRRILNQFTAETEEFSTRFARDFPILIARSETIRQEFYKF